VGELFIGGPQLAQGYLKDPEQTAKVFVNNPFRPGTTIYATGDLVRMNPVDGSLAFLGRRDTQIKIRGLRVEIGEIEAVLKATSNIISNAVVIKVDIGRECLVAFLEYPSDEEKEDVTMVSDDSLGPLLASLRHSVRRKLPSYMAPMIYVALNRFPLMSSGKLDRGALERYFYVHEKSIREVQAIPGAIDPHAVPRTELQAMMRSLWASVLQLEEGLLGIDDDFYTSGGDSISAIRLSSAARQAGLYLPVADVIRNSTIRAMASIATSLTDTHHFDEDDTPSVALERMSPSDLTLLNLDQEGLDLLRNDLLPKHGLSVRFGFILSHTSPCIQHNLLLAMSSTYTHLHLSRPAYLWRVL
jgi:aryl carrier-like protein